MTTTTSTTATTTTSTTTPTTTSTEFHMPSLGADMEDGIVTEWLVAPGDEVRRGQVIAVVETDKSDIEVEIFLDGVVTRLLVAEGERVPVGTPIALVDRTDTRTGATARSARGTQRPADRVAAQQAASETDRSADRVIEPPPERRAPEPPGARSAGVAAGSSRATARAITSPLVRHLAEELHIDVARVHGSGPGGRVLRSDVERARRRPPVSPRARLVAERIGIDLDALLDQRGASAQGPLTGDEVLAAVARPALAPSTAGAPPPKHPAERADRTRRAIASLMSSSWATIPHYHVGSRLDVTPALERLAGWNERHGVRERVLPAALWLHAVARAAAAVPALNGWWVDDEFRPADHVDLGVVVARRGGGIVVPTIQRADELSIPETMLALADIVARVRANRLRSSDAAPASITVTNLGDLGADVVHGVIHPPQVALVGIGRVHEEPWAELGQLSVRSVLHITVAADHRATDGLVGATFLSRLATIIGDIHLDPPPEELVDERHGRQHHEGT